MRLPSAAQIERFHAKYIPEPMSGCWLWMAALDRDGYGIHPTTRGTFRAHRLSYCLHVGPVPPGLALDHLCRNRACVNYRHLQCVTAAVNVRRGATPRLTEAQVRSVFMDTRTYKEMAEAYRVGVVTLWSIRARQTWRDVTADLTRVQ